MARVPFLLLLSVAFIVPGHFASAQAVTYQGPITITSGGTYSGSWQSTNANTPAVSIRTTAPVTITNSNIQGAGTLIDANQSGANVTITNTNGYALVPPAGNYPGRFVDASGIAKIDIEHNYFEGTGGIYVLTPQSGAVITVKYNNAKNINGRQSTGSGYVSGTDCSNCFYSYQFVQFDKVNGATAEIAWNQVINDPYVSRPEDVINMYASNGSSGNPILIHDNYIRGSYPGYPDTDSFSGGGIISDGSSSSWLKVYNNQVIETVNYGIAIAGGSNSEFYGNTVMGTGLLPSGARAAAQNVGMYVNGSGSGNSVHDNTVGWYSASGSRNDSWFPNCPSSTCAYNNTSLPSPVTLAQEDAQFTVWLNKLSANGITVGTGGSGNTTPSPTVSLSANPSSITSGQSSTLTWSSGNATTCSGTGFSASGTSGSVSVTPTGTTTFRITCTGAGGSASASAAVTVTSAQAPTAFIVANPTTITSGQSSTLTWSSANATSCSGTGFSTGSTLAGSASVTPSVSTTYSITCTGAGGTSASASATVSVSSGTTLAITGFTLINAATQQSIGPLTNGSTVDLSAVGSSLNIRGDASSDVVSVLFQFDTSTQLENSRPFSVFGDSAGVYNSVALGVGSHTLTATGNSMSSAQGTQGAPKTITFTVVNGSTASIPTVAFSANPATISAGGSSTLTWSSTNATSCTGSGLSTGGAVSGSLAVTPSVTTSYSVTCTGAGGTSAPSSATVVVSSVTPGIFQVGARVKTTALLNVRAKANAKTGKILCTQPAGALGTIKGGPSGNQGYTWWNIDFDTGCDGWSVQNYLTTSLAAAATPSNTAVEGAALTDTLAMGSKGPQVSLLQGMLTRLGFFAASSTGYFGSATESAVKDFQAAHNLASVGIVGPQTRALLNTARW